MIKFNDKEVVFEKFPNGETHLIHESLESNDEFERVYFKYEDDSDLVKLIILKNYLDEVKFYNSAIVLILSYMPYSRMDRSENYSPFTLKYIANVINGLKFDEILVIEPHSHVTTALLNRTVPYLINEDLVKEVVQLAGIDTSKDYIMFPDAGACSRYKNFTYPNVIIGNKTRNFQTGDITGLQLIGDFDKGGNKALIIDDLSSYGGTFVHSAKALKAQGIEEVYLLVAHAENNIFKGKFKDNPKDENEEEKTLFSYIDHLFTTDSILTEWSSWHNQKFLPQLTMFDAEQFAVNKIMSGEI